MAVVAASSVTRALNACALSPRNVSAEVMLAAILRSYSCSMAKVEDKLQRNRSVANSGIVGP